MMNASPRFLELSPDDGGYSTQIKVCGITSIDDALFAAKCGVSAIGHIFYPPSGRNLESHEAKVIRENLPAEVASVAVVVDPDDDLLEAIIRDVKPTFFQFHGNESLQRCREPGIPFIKAVRVRTSEQVVEAVDSYPDASGLLLDAYVKDKVGGTGQTFSWDFVPQVELPIILAGGLHSGNVAGAIDKVKPVAVDVSSGVEVSEGIKNHAAIREFVNAVDTADRTTYLIN